MPALMMIVGRGGGDMVYLSFSRLWQFQRICCCNLRCPHHTIKMLHFKVLLHSVTDSIISRIHVNTTKPHNITYTLVATCVIPWSLKCGAVFIISSNIKHET